MDGWDVGICVETSNKQRSSSFEITLCLALEMKLDKTRTVEAIILCALAAEGEVGESRCELSEGVFYDMFDYFNTIVDVERDIHEREC